MSKRINWDGLCERIREYKSARKACCIIVGADFSERTVKNANKDLLIQRRRLDIYRAAYQVEFDLDHDYQIGLSPFRDRCDCLLPEPCRLDSPEIAIFCGKCTLEMMGSED